MHIRVTPVEILQIRNQIITADGIAGTDAQLAAAQGIGLHNLIFTPFYQVDGRLDMAQQNLTLGGQLHPLCAPDKEVLVQLLFQYLDGLAHRRLRDKELLGCFGEA